MAFRIRTFIPSLALALAAPLTPLSANITAMADNGFAVVQGQTVEATPEQIWAILVEPSLWWNPDNSFTGSSIYFTLDAVPGGCFCEKIPAGETAGGGVRHFTVLYVDKPRVLRFEGALGPLQSEAVTGTMTIAMEPRDDGTTAVSLSYVAGGYIRGPVPAMAQTLDQVTGDALARLMAVAEGGDPDDAVYVARPRAKAPDATTPAETPETESDSETEGESADAPVEEEVTVESPGASLGERLELDFGDDDVELSGSRREVDDAAESGSTEEEAEAEDADVDGADDVPAASETSDDDLADEEDDTDADDAAGSAEEDDAMREDAVPMLSGSR